MTDPADTDDLADHVFPPLSEDARVEAIVTPSRVVRVTDDRTKPPPGVYIDFAWGCPFALIPTDGRTGSAALPEEQEANAEAVAAAWAFVDRIRAEERERIARALMSEPVASVSTSVELDLIDWLRAGAPGSKP